MTNVSGTNNSSVNVSGGTVDSVVGLGASVVNLRGGNISNIHELSGTLNLYGSGFALANTLFGNYYGYDGTYSTLTGTLLDGAALNATLFLKSGIHLKGQGNTQDFPILPDSNNNGVFTFNDCPSGLWVDPPLVGSYEFSMLGGDFFTSILDFPAGIGDADGLFTVLVGNVVLGQFSSGTAVNFADFGFAGGVSGFTISGIDPTVDGGNPTAFPINLGFSSGFASFTMTGITGTAAAPEPGTFALLALGSLAFAGRKRRA